MASTYFDKSTGWWNIKYFAGPSRGRVKQPLCKHPGDWRLRLPRRAPDTVKALAAPYEEIERRAKIGIEARVRATPLPSHLEGYVTRRSRTWRPNTTEAVSNAVRKFLGWCSGRKIETLQAVTPLVCRDWIESRLAEGAARSTVLTERSNLMPAWSEALQDDLIDANPWLKAKVPGKSRKEVPTAWTPEEVARLVAATDGWLRDLVLLGVNTGIRIDALLSLRWEQVDWGAGLIRVRAAESKSGRPYEVPLSATAHDVLARRLNEAGTNRGPIFLNPGTGRSYRSRTTYTRIGRAVAKAGIPNYGDYNHVMRRTFATCAINAGVPMEVVQRCLGHSSLAQTERSYAHMRFDRIKQGMAGFDLGTHTTPPDSPSPPEPGTPSRPATSPSSGSD